MLRITLGMGTAVLGLLTGCFGEVQGENNADGTSGGGQSGDHVPEGGDLLGAAGDPGHSQAICASPGYFQESPPRTTRFDARIMDSKGYAVPNMEVETSGPNSSCFHTMTNAEGHLTSCSPSEGCPTLGLTVRDVSDPVLLVGFGRTYARLGYPIPEGATVDLGTVGALRLPELGSGEPVVAGASVTSNGVKLSVVAGATVDPMPFPPFDPEEGYFRAAFMPDDMRRPGNGQDFQLEMIVGLAPPYFNICPRAKLEVPNRNDWEPGTEVEFFLHGIGYDEAWAPFGGWARISGGNVSEDGSMIVTEDKGGLPYISTVGIRRKR